MRARLPLAGAAVLALCAGIPLAHAAEPMTTEASPSRTAMILFLIFVAITLLITSWAARRNRSAADFYAAGAGISGVQNGLAIAGDYMSAASFLGISGLVFASGYDGLIYSVGWLVGWPIIMFLIAERLRNLGRYTFADVVSFRLGPVEIRTLSALGTLTVVAFYLIAQMVGAGKLIELLFRIPYLYAVMAVGALMIFYVALGGMLATTWVQIIKAVLLMAGVTITAALVLYHSGFSVENLLAGAAANHPRGDVILSPGVLFQDPVQVTTILVSMLFGTLGLPHILMRLFTVPDMHEAKKSAFYASLFMGYFYLALIILGFGTAMLLYNDPAFFTSEGKLIGGNNMAAIHLATAVGGDLLTGFMSAVTFATILAVVAGLTVSGAAAISHDLYAEVICKGAPDSHKELQLTRLTTLVIGVIAVILGILFENENVAFIATMPMVVAASVNFPVLFLSLFWPGLTTRGAIWGALAGLVSSVGLIIVGPQVWVSVLGFEEPLFPYNYPALFTLPLALAVTWLFSVTDRSVRGAIDRDNYLRLLIRSEYGPEDEELAVARH